MFELKIEESDIDALTKSIQESIKTMLIQKVSNLTCPEHGKGVKATISKGSYSFECCCDSFRNIVMDALKS